MGTLNMIDWTGQISLGPYPLRDVTEVVVRQNLVDRALEFFQPWHMVLDFPEVVLPLDFVYRSGKLLQLLNVGKDILEVVIPVVNWAFTLKTELTFLNEI